MDIITRGEARAQGLKKYFTGKPCKHGHISVRLVFGGCITCAKVAYQRTKESDPEFLARMAARQRKYFEDNKEKMRKYNREYHLKYISDEHGVERRKAANRAYEARLKERREQLREA